MTDDARETRNALIFGLILAASTLFVLQAFLPCTYPPPEPTPAAQYDDGLHSVLVPEAQP